MESYPSLIDDRDASHQEWLHVVHAGALLRDELAALKLKRRLDRGTATATDVEDPRVTGRVGISTAEQVAAAGAAARRAQPEWADRSVEERVSFVRLVGERLRTHADQFAQVLMAEGHPKRLAEWEVASALEMSSEDNLVRCRRQLSEVTWIGQRETRLVRKPDGVVAVHPPHNAATSNSMLALGALLVGNAVVIKAPRSAPLGTAWIWREIVHPALRAVDAPAGTMNLICASPAAALQHWLVSDDIDDLMFFGESERGIEIGQQWHASGKKAVLELSGNDGVLVWRDAELHLAVEALTECFYGSAQICMVPKYALVHADVADELIERLLAAVERIRPGYPDDEKSLLSPVLKSLEFEHIVQQSQDAGARLLCGGHRLDVDGTRSDSGLFMEPTVLRVDGLGPAAELDVVRRETFFPMLPIVVVRPEDSGPDGTLAACVDFMNRNRYGLRNSLWMQDAAGIDYVCRRLVNGGILKINDSHIGQVAGLPTHGGTGLTGGPFGEAHYPLLRTSHLQAISIGTAVYPRREIFAGLGGDAAGSDSLGVDLAGEPVGASRGGAT